MVQSARPGSRARVGLSRDAIVAGALELIEAEGLDAFSVRALAKRIGVYPTSLHWHAGSRTELLALVVSSVSQTVPVPTSPRWQDCVRELADGFRATLHAHPAIAPVLVTQIVYASPELPSVDVLLDRLEAAGWRGEELVDVYNAVVGAVVGFVGVELASIPAEDHTQWQDQFSDSLSRVDAERFPALHRNLPFARNRALMVRWESGTTRPLDGAWAVLLDSLVAGLEAQQR
jgi:AcrR family transcriptional regulator